CRAHRGRNQRLEPNSATLVTLTVRFPLPSLRRMETRLASRGARIRPNPGGFKSHEHIDRERTERRPARHAHTTRRIAAGAGCGPPAVAREGEGADPRP